MKLVRIAMIALGLAACAGAAAAAPLSRVRVDQGVLAAAPAEQGVAVFEGVPYAAPPLGRLRWRPPQPGKAWAGARPADRFGPSCMQDEIHQIGPWTQEFFARPPFSEDCLYLNVWTPAASARARLPVMVWFHGGALTQGGTSLPMYDGAALARRGVVVVSVNYRLGVFGFLAHPQLSAESPRHASGDYGFLDQRAALEWVRRNIAAFGGDPRKVTVFGQSAGARSVALQILSPLSHGLFARAIAESGVQAEAAGGLMPATALPDAEAQGLAFAKAAGAGSLAELRAIPAARLQAISGFHWGPVVDGWFLPEPPGRLLAQGRLADVPLLTGFNAAEGGEQPGGHAATMARAAAWLQARAAHARTPAYFYDYDHVLPGPTASRYGAFHSAELAYVFGTLSSLDRPLGPQDREVSDELQAYWVNFARTGDPNGKGLAPWPAFDPGRPQVMQIGDHPGARPIAPPGELDRLFKTIAAPAAQTGSR